MTWGIRVLVVLVAAAVVASAGAAQQRTYRRVLFVAIAGHGTVSSKPVGLTCPGHCRAIFLKDQHMKLVAHPAAGWKLVRWSGTCSGKNVSCTFYLSDSHDCANGMCPIGAFGERVTFARDDTSN